MFFCSAIHTLEVYITYLVVYGLTTLELFEARYVAEALKYYLENNFCRYYIHDNIVYMYVCMYI